MKIIYRNFIRLLSSGAFGNICAIENMSEFKWHKLLSVAKEYGVYDYIRTGAIKIGNSAIPKNIYSEFNKKSNLYNVTCDEDAGNDNFASLKKAKKFSNPYLNSRYVKLVFNEIHSIDTSINSLVLLNKLIDNVNSFLDFGVNIRELAKLGVYLRKYGDKIDFVKVEDWIKILRIEKMCSLIACHLVVLFCFEKDELPFLKREDEKLYETIRHALEVKKDIVAVSGKLHEAQYGGEIIINPITKSNTHPLKYFKHLPIESLSRFVANIFRSLSNIDE